ncbi:hypothetical protein EKH55_0560 [Sinorhizobium alkalisoli]|nr:hypothetical protein EKH55_0560 [Sinorhizobium alkalisoli]
MSLSLAIDTDTVDINEFAADPSRKTLPKSRAQSGLFRTAG